jgi:hypothetical protein
MLEGRSSADCLAVKNVHLRQPKAAQPSFGLQCPIRRKNVRATYAAPHDCRKPQAR